MPPAIPPTNDCTDGRSQQRQCCYRRRLYISCLMFVVSTNFATRIATPPLYRLVELTICRAYYQTNNPSVIGRTGDVEEALCKLNVIQEKLAYLMGVVETIRIVCALVVTVPFGMVSDRYGRKLVLYLNVGTTISYFGWIMVIGYWHDTLPVEYIFLSGLTYLLGGGDSIAFASLFAAVTDFISNDIERTTLFAHLNTANYVTMFLSSSAAAGAMTINLWLPLWIGMCALLISFVSIYTLPVSNCADDYAAIQDLGSENLPAPAEEDALIAHGSLENGQSRSYRIRAATNVEESFGAGLSRKAVHQTRVIIKCLRNFLKYPKNFRLCLVVFLVTTLAKESIDILLQYVSKRYHVSIAKAAILFTIKAAVSVLLYTVFVPFSLNFLAFRLGHENVTANLYCARLSIGFLFAGALAIALATTLWWAIAGKSNLDKAMIIYTMGSALFLFMLSLAKSTFAPLWLNIEHGLPPVVSEGEQSGYLYSLIGVMESVGSVIGRPLITMLWIWGMEIGDMGVGLPFFATAGAYLTISVALWQMKP